MREFDLSGLNILLLDDSRSVRMVLKTLLRGLGVTGIYESGDTEEALLIARLSQPDLVLVDYDLGETSGLEAIRAFRNDPLIADRSMPLILLAPPALPYAARGAEAAGADAVLPKPINAGTLGLRIHQVVQAGAGRAPVQLSQSA